MIMNKPSMRSAKMPASEAAARSSRPAMRPEAEVMDGESETGCGNRRKKAAARTLERSFGLPHLGPGTRKTEVRYISRLTLFHPSAYCRTLLGWRTARRKPHMEEI